MTGDPISAWLLDHLETKFDELELIPNASADWILEATDLRCERRLPCSAQDFGITRCSGFSCYAIAASLPHEPGLGTRWIDLCVHHYGVLKKSA